MRDYYIFNAGRMKRKENTVYFENEQGERRALPIEDVENVHFYGEVDLNTKFINFISGYSILLHFYNYYGFYTSTLYPRKKNVSGFLVVNQSKHYLNKQKRQYLAQCFVESSAYHIIKNLKNYDDTQEYIDKINIERENIYLTKEINELMGIEGRIRKIYYSVFNKMLKYGFELEGRNKRPTTDPVNALISFGNSLMYTTVLGQIYKTQLDPTISYLHEPSTKRFSLSLDIAEIFKPMIIDPLIFKLINNKMINKNHFVYEEGICLLNEEGRKKFIAEFEKKLSTTIKHRKLNRSVSYKTFIKLECYKIIKHVIDDEVYKPLKAWW